MPIKHIVRLFVVLVVVQLGCGGSSTPMGKIVAAIDAADLPAGTASVRFAVVRGGEGCSAPPLETATVPVGSGPTQPLATFMLPAGTYDVCATPLTSSGAAAGETWVAVSVTVAAGATVQLTLAPDGGGRDGGAGDGDAGDAAVADGGTPDVAADAPIDSTMDAAPDSSMDAPVADGSAAPDAVDAARPSTLTLLSPLSTGIVTSRRPRLAWALPNGADGAQVQLCRDRACTGQVVAFDAAGAAGSPPSDLPGGATFWRARATSAGVAFGAWTPVWELTVAALSTAASSRAGMTLDVNGDGYGDIVVGALGAATEAINNAAGRAYVFLGSATGLPAAPATTLEEPVELSAAYFGANVASAGDVNNDGFSDVIVGATGYTPSGKVAPRAYQFLGGPSGLSTTAAPLGGLPAESDHYDLSIAAGDVNGDGYGDLAVGTPVGANVRIYLGSATGLVATPAVTLTSPDGTTSHFGYAVSSGDVNGDGYGDVIVGSDKSAKVHVYLGGPTGIAMPPSVTLTSPHGVAFFGASVSGGGDLDGDGFTDVVVAAYGDATTAGEIYVFRGAPGGPANVAAFTIPQPDGMNGRFQVDLASNGDVNGDGYADLVIGNQSYVTSTVEAGRGYVSYGSPSGPQVSGLQALTSQGNLFGTSVAEPGDVDGDGLGDVIVGAFHGAADNLGRVFFYPGHSGSLPATPTTTLAMPATDHAGNKGGFGSSVD
jgi:hypothetical protein